MVTGPVGGGKSTVALALADRFRTAGRTAAVIDLDVVYGMARQAEGYGESAIWATARRGMAALADAFFADGIDVVMAEGGFFTPEELATLTDNLTTPAERRFVTLMVSYEQALVRVAGDLTRGMSRDAEFLMRLHTQFVAALPFLQASSLLVEADRRDPNEVAERIADAMLDSRAGTI